MARIAIIGTGISGLGAAYLLHRHHDIVVYEKNAVPGGHTRTLTLSYDGVPVAVDTGFIVFNEPNYPHFSAMLRHLGVATHESDMTFAATIRDGWLEWGAEGLNTILGQRRNVVRPAFYRLFRDVMRFNAQAPKVVEQDPDLTLGALITKLGLGDWFRRYYLLPMASAIWSCPPKKMLAFPAQSFVRFFSNHGLMAMHGQPQWRTVSGGARSYVEKLTVPFAPRIRRGCGAACVTRYGPLIEVNDDHGHSEIYDHVVFACHADEALALMCDANATERALLGAFTYQRNIAVLHRDERVMPRRKRCWAAWNYRADANAGAEAAVSVSYWMNRLQGIDSRRPLFVTINPSCAIAPDSVFDTHEFSHPVFDGAAMKAQAALQARQGVRNTWFCGAHMRNGFHEDGLWSAVAVAEKFGIATPWAVGPRAVPEARPAPLPFPKPILADGALT